MGYLPRTYHETKGGWVGWEKARAVELWSCEKKSRMTWHLKPSWKIHLSLHKPCGNSIPTLMETAGQQSCSVFNLLKIRLSHDGQPLGIVVMQSSVWQVRKVVSNSQIFRLYWDITCGSIQMHLVLFFCGALQEWHWHWMTSVLQSWQLLLVMITVPRSWKGLSFF